LILWEHLPPADSALIAKALARDFKCPVLLSRIKNMPCSRMCAQDSKLHTNDVDFLGLKTQRTIQLFEPRQKIIDPRLFIHDPNPSI
jgi:hypothetical protein